MEYLKNTSNKKKILVSLQTDYFFFNLLLSFDEGKEVS